MINEEGGFPRLLELILCNKDDDAGLHRLLLELLYEMSRIQRIRAEELGKNLCISGQLKLEADPYRSADRRRFHSILVSNHRGVI